MSSKRQMTMAKMMREQSVRERRAKKLEKKQARKQAAAELASGVAPVEVADAIDAPPATDTPQPQ